MGWMQGGHRGRSCNKGSSVYNVHKKIRFFNPPRLLDTELLPLCEHKHAVNMKYLKQLVQWPSGQKAEFQLQCDCNLFKIVLHVLIIYIEKCSPFYSVHRPNSGKKNRKSIAREETRLTSVGSNLLRQRPHGVDSFPMRPPEPGPLLPHPCEHHKWMAINQV